ncbi:MAG: M6 family metalloprotease domain-containing protein, partial [Fibrobacter sp.]|nr:M6 family metalloprotease domain-containing protein [Fibrobacter sp.]
VLIWGDEFHQNVESPDGYSLVRDDEGWICYAVLSSDGSEYVSNGVHYTGEKRGQSLKKHLRINKESVRKKERRNKEILGYENLISPSSSGHPRFSPAPSENGQPATPKSVVGLTILIDFPDQKTSFTQADIEAFCNLPGYAEFGNNGSIYDYFNDVSNGLMQYTNVVTPFITADKDKSYYDSGEGYGHVQELITCILNKLKNNGFDLSSVTTKNNEVVALNIFYAGTASAGWANGLWAHSGTYYGMVNINGIRFYRYQMSDLGRKLQMGTFVHENGHMLMGWPDLYSYEEHSNGVGMYCVMNSINPYTNPQQPNPYFRSLAGWIDVTDITGKRRGTVYSHTANSHSAYTYVRDSKEFYIIEARRRIGRSSGLPGDGLAIWHVHNGGLNTDPSKGFPLLALVQADGRNHLENRINSGDGNDLFRSNFNDRFNSTTNPAARYHDGTESGIDIADISAVGTEMNFTIGENAEIPTYMLIVQNGNGSGTYSPGDTVEISAPLSSAIGTFVRWSYDTSVIIDDPSAIQHIMPSSGDTTFSIGDQFSVQTFVVMGSSDAVVTANYAVPIQIPSTVQTESAAVLSGNIAQYSFSGEGEYARLNSGAYMEFLINAETGGTYQFSYRAASRNTSSVFRLRDVVSDTVMDSFTVASSGRFQTWGTIAGKQLAVSPGQYIWRLELLGGSCDLDWFAVNTTGLLTVVNGSGSGVYSSGTVVEIKADAPPESYKMFAGWSGSETSLSAVSDPLLSVTSVTLGVDPITLTATYVDFPTVGIVMPSGTGHSVTVNDTFFFDNGGKYSDYSNDFFGEITFVPAVKGDAVVLSFEELDICESAGGKKDSLLIYSGSGSSKELWSGLVMGERLPEQFVSGDPNGKVTVQFTSGSSQTGSGWKIHVTTEPISAVSMAQSALPAHFDLRVGYNGKISYQLPRGENTRMALYNMQGKMVSLLYNGYRTPGFYSANLNSGKFSLSQGFYVVRMTAGSYTKNMKVFLKR